METSPSLLPRRGGGIDFACMYRRGLFAGTRESRKRVITSHERAETAEGAYGAILIYSTILQLLDSVPRWP